MHIITLLHHKIKHMKKRYLPLLIASLFLGSCSQDLPSIPEKNQKPTETPDPGPTTPEKPDYSKLKILLEQLNLEDANLFRVKAALNAQDSAQVQTELLRYFRVRTTLRTDVKHASVNPEDKEGYKGKAPANAVKQANDALNHLFLAHKSFDPIDYGTDINWAKPHSDKEVLFQVHRMYWWLPMGQTYWSTLDEKYAKEWVFQLQDWIRKNPCEKSSPTFSYAWRPLEIASRIDDQTALLNYFVTSEYFTPEFTVEFLLNYYNQCNYLINHFPYDNGNHLLFCGKGIYMAGSFYPEFKDAVKWREAGVKLLNDELSRQVTDDGVQFEYAPKYQAASITEFLGATDYARLNGRTADFPQAYTDKIRKMIDVIINISMNVGGKFDYPMFGDTPHVGSLSGSFNNWLKYYPTDEVMKFFANSKNGNVPDYTTQGHPQGGFYTLRDGWKISNMMMSVTAHPEQVWHSHPDIGTFELSVKGRLFMPDAGFYKYEGDAATNAERNLYRRSSVHKIMTLDNKDIDVKNVSSKLTTTANYDVLQIENQSYANLKVYRTIFFHKKSPKCYIIVDEGAGSATGQIDVHFNMLEDADISYDESKMQMYTGFTDNNNLLIQSFSPASTDFSLIKVQGNDARISYEYGKFVQGKAVSFRTGKQDETTKQVVTVLYPFATVPLPTLNLTTLSGSQETGNLEVQLNLDGTTVSFQAQ